MGFHRFQILNYVSVFLVSFALVTFSGCDKDDPKPVNDQEVFNRFSADNVIPRECSPTGTLNPTRAFSNA